MKRIWKNFNTWEDYKHGMYSGSIQDNLIPVIVDFFTGDGFEIALSNIFDQWPNCINHNLSYVSSNRQSYLGQACCAFSFGASIKTTTKAWNSLSDEVKLKANLIADKYIDIYEKQYYKEPEVKLNEKLS